MKTILVPVDFSEQSINAVEYAAEMALYSNSKLILIHVYDNTPPILDMPFATSMPVIENGIKEELSRIVQMIERSYGPNLMLKSIVRLGYVIEEILEAAKQNDVEMIVMGMQGTNYLTERLFGSVATSLIRRSSRPVLVVGMNTRFEKPNKILLATDGNRMDDKNTYLPLKRLLSVFKSHLYIVRVLPEMILNDPHDDLNAFDLDEEWLSHSLSFHQITRDNIINGINEFVHDHEIDMVVMIPHKHDFFERIMHEPQTQKMSFHAIVPVLAIPELR